MKVVIYKITILTTGKSYIGETNNLARRISQHKCCAKDRSNIRKGMYLDWIAGGINNYSVEILEELDNCKLDDILKLESKYISLYNTEYDGYNVAYYRSKTHTSKLSGRHLSQERVKETLKYLQPTKPGKDNISANRYYIEDNAGNTYCCECRNDIVNQLGISFKQVKCLISFNGEWYTPRHHINNKYVDDKRSFRLIKKEKIN